MGDITIQWNPATGTGDFVMSGPSLELGNDLETAILVSLCTDAVADPSDILLPGQSADPRGWWADTYNQDQIGSKLWQVFSRQTTQDTLNWARDDIYKSLYWMIEDGVASSITVTTAYVAKGALGAQIIIVQPSGTTNQFSYVWTQGA